LVRKYRTTLLQEREVGEGLREKGRREGRLAVEQSVFP
jgi:hypothetical protein